MGVHRDNVGLGMNEWDKHFASGKSFPDGWGYRDKRTLITVCNHCLREMEENKTPYWVCEMVCNDNECHMGQVNV